MFKAATAASNTLMILSVNTSTPHAQVVPAAPGGTLWIGHETGDLTMLKNGIFESFKLPSEWNEDVVASIGSDEQGDIWIQSRQGRLARLRDGHVILPVQDVISSFGLATMATDNQGKVWVWRGGQLGYLAKGELIIPPQRDHPPGPHPRPSHGKVEQVAKIAGKRPFLKAAQAA